jgi:hypothetical protein
MPTISISLKGWREANASTKARTLASSVANPTWSVPLISSATHIGLSGGGSHDGFSPNEMKSVGAIVSALLAARRDLAAARDACLSLEQRTSVDGGASVFDMIDDLVTKLPLYADVCEARAREFWGLTHSYADGIPNSAGNAAREGAFPS